MNNFCMKHHETTSRFLEVWQRSRWYSWSMTVYFHNLLHARQIFTGISTVDWLNLQYILPCCSQRSQQCNSWVKPFPTNSCYSKLQDITRLITISVAAFCECIAKDQGTRRMASAYALDYVRRLNKKKRWSDLQADTKTIQQPAKETSRGWCPGSIFSKVLPSG